MFENAVLLGRSGLLPFFTPRRWTLRTRTASLGMLRSSAGSCGSGPSFSKGTGLAYLVLTELKEERI